MKKILTFLLVAVVPMLSYAQVSYVPTAILGELSGNGPWERSDIMLPEILNVKSEPAGIYQVVSFKMVVKTSDGIEKVAFAQGNKISPEMAGNLNIIDEGSTVKFEKIIAKRTDNVDETVLLAPVIYAITTKLKKPIKELEILKNAQVSFSSLDITSFTSEDLKKQNQLIVASPDDKKYTVTSFSFIIAYKSKPPVMATYNGDSITGLGISMIESIESGDRILIERIIVETMENGSIVRKGVPPLVLLVP